MGKNVTYIFRSININVIPSFGRIVNVGENDKRTVVNNCFNFS